MDSEKLIITPKTRVLQLLEAYPQLEVVLIGYVPAFKKLKNPFLRNTVARITTLQQAAAIGNVKTEDLINRLRREVGQKLISVSGESTYNTNQPKWYDENSVSHATDVRRMLEAGEHPVNQIMADLNSLEPDKIYKVIAPFIPAPLIDKASSLGFDHWLKKEADELFFIYFKRRPV